jgi:hypothetical protein
MQLLERPELIERMQRLAHRVLGEGILLLNTNRLDDAGDRRVLRQPFLLDEQFEGREPPPASGHGAFSGLGAIAIDERAHTQRLQQPAPGDIFREILDAHPRLDAPHVCVRCDELIQRDIACAHQCDLGHFHSLREGRTRASLSLLFPSASPKGPSHFSRLRQRIPAL